MPRSQKTQPIRAPSGGNYGARKQLESAQQAVPLPETRSQGTGGGRPQPSQAVPISRPDITAPTARPSEPITAGVEVGAGSNQLGVLPDDPVSFLRAVMIQAPSPGVARLMEMAARRRL